MADKLKKDLKLKDVYAISTATTLSAGLFLLPGIAAKEAGPAIILSYLLAALPLIPAIFSKVELATAMPKAGGVYYFLDRTLGPYFGTVGGIGSWLTLILKVSFALVGMGAYISLFLPDFRIVPIAIILAIVLGLINLSGAKKTGSLQVTLLISLMMIIIYFLGTGLGHANPVHFQDFFIEGYDSVISTAGLVYVSYLGLSKVASLSEEIENPERNLPLGVFLAMITAIVVYGLSTYVIVGVVPMSELAGDLTPIATAARYIMGEWGVVLMSIAAMLAFVSVANGGMLSASRYPLAMSRDHMMPSFFRKLTKQGSPYYSVLVTVVSITAILLLFDPLKIAKLASAFQLLVFSFVCLSVIVIRESKIDSYDPGYKSPLYPWMQIFGIITPLFFIYKMGVFPVLFTIGLIVIGTLWYIFYAKDKVVRNGAIYHMFERLGKLRYEGLDAEFRGILKEKGLREEDPFDLIVTRSYVIDLPEKKSFELIVDQATSWISQMVNQSQADLAKSILEGTLIGATPVTHGVALPHLRIDGLEQAEMVLVRIKKGCDIVFKSALTNYEEDTQTVHAIFFLMSPKTDPGQHLRILAEIAGRVDDHAFKEDWFKATNEHSIKECLLRNNKSISLLIERDKPTFSLIGRIIKDVDIPENCLIALLSRSGVTQIPQERTVIKENDRVTIIGDIKGIRKLYGIYHDHNEIINSVV